MVDRLESRCYNGFRSRDTVLLCGRGVRATLNCNSPLDFPEKNSISLRAAYQESWWHVPMSNPALIFGARWSYGNPWFVRWHAIDHIPPHRNGSSTCYYVCCGLARHWLPNGSCQVHNHRVDQSCRWSMRHQDVHPYQPRSHQMCAMHHTPQHADIQGGFACICSASDTNISRLDLNCFLSLFYGGSLRSLWQFT